MEMEMQTSITVLFQNSQFRLHLTQCINHILNIYKLW